MAGSDQEDKILSYLRENEGAVVSGKALAQATGCKVTRVPHYVRCLRARNVPVYSRTGINGGYVYDPSAAPDKYAPRFQTTPHKPPASRPSPPAGPAAVRPTPQQVENRILDRMLVVMDRLPTRAARRISLYLYDRYGDQGGTT